MEHSNRLWEGDPENSKRIVRAHARLVFSAAHGRSGPTKGGRLTSASTPAASSRSSPATSSLLTCGGAASRRNLAMPDSTAQAVESWRSSAEEGGGRARRGWRPIHRDEELALRLGVLLGAPHPARRPGQLQLHLARERVLVVPDLRRFAR
jgi:hypothetical protein